MFTNRRSFLKSSFGAGLVAYGLNVTRALARSAVAAPGVGAPGPQETVLVVVQLTRGNDGRHTVVPFTDPLYAKYRPNLNLDPKHVKKLTKDIAIHPAMAGSAELYQQR